MSGNLFGSAGGLLKVFPTIRLMSLENATRGEPRIQSELTPHVERLVEDGALRSYAELAAPTFWTVRDEFSSRAPQRCACVESEPTWAGDLLGIAESGGTSIS